MDHTKAVEDAISPNVNCLEGKRCPACGSFGPFEVVVSVRLRLYDNGTDSADDGTTEYGEESPASCLACGHEGTFGDFDE